MSDKPQCATDEELRKAEMRRAIWAAAYGAAFANETAKGRSEYFADREARIIAFNAADWGTR